MSDAHDGGELPTPVEGRSCGTCTLCCKVMRIDALNKPVGIWCKHAVTKKGCAIYPERPTECQTFYCAWLINEQLGEEWRPTKSKMVLFYEGEGNRIAAHVDGGWPAAWRNEPYYSQLKQWAWNAVEHKGQVCVYVKDHVTVILPTKDVDLGRFEPGDHIITAQRADGWDAYKIPLKDVRPEDRGKWINVSKDGIRKLL